ncbi:MAG: hypothetical protein BroJett011_07020 [Chloroflexota bacterium]|nr:MAG: hypothetical protein BroJett011_07020 [Chloroflexota bacterium]
MSFKVQNSYNTSHIECDPTDFIIRNEQDILDLIVICGENNTSKVLIYESNFSPDFFDLKTTFAGALFQKFANYRMQGAAVISFEKIRSERFKELIFESNKGNLFRFFEDKAAAEKWLAQE